MTDRLDVVMSRITEKMKFLFEPQHSSHDITFLDLFHESQVNQIKNFAHFDSEYLSIFHRNHQKLGNRENIYSKYQSEPHKQAKFETKPS